MFKHLSEFTKIKTVALEEETHHHPKLSDAEVTRMRDKLSKFEQHLDALHSIIREVDNATGTAHKLHHIGVKAGFDMGALHDVQKHLHALDSAYQDMHQTWGTQLEGDTGAFDGPEDQGEIGTEQETDDQ